jgi:hypothetical protein
MSTGREVPTPALGTKCPTRSGLQLASGATEIICGYAVASMTALYPGFGAEGVCGGVA